MAELIESRTYNFIKKETMAQVFSCEFCKIYKNTFFTEHLWATASGLNLTKIFKESTIHLNHDRI